MGHEVRTGSRYCGHFHTSGAVAPSATGAPQTSAKNGAEKRRGSQTLVSHVPQGRTRSHGAAVGTFTQHITSAMITEMVGRWFQAKTVGGEYRSIRQVGVSMPFSARRRIEMVLVVGGLAFLAAAL